MELAPLRYFQTIVQCGSLTAAARVLKVSQPTLTVAVQHLEEQLGTTLLLRNRTGVTPTRTGQELLNNAVEIFALVERAEQRILGLETEDVGSFVIGCHESLGAYFLPAFMSAFLDLAPRIELSLWNGTSAAVAEAVVVRQVDFGLVVNPRPHPDLVMVELFDDAVDVFIAAAPSPGEPRSRRGEELPATLAAARERIRKGPLVFAGRVGQCQELLDRFAVEGLLPTRLLSCGDLELVKSLALAGVGVALLPRRVAAYGQRGRLRRLHPELPSVPDRISLLYRADLHRTRGALRVKEALVAHGKGLDAAAEGEAV